MELEQLRRDSSKITTIIEGFQYSQLAYRSQAFSDKFVGIFVLIVGFSSFVLFRQRQV